jgi:hypothetical protein
MKAEMGKRMEEKRRKKRTMSGLSTIYEIASLRYVSCGVKVVSQDQVDEKRS